MSPEILFSPPKGPGTITQEKSIDLQFKNQRGQYPKVYTDRFKNSYVNRLIFKYNLAM